MPYFIPDRNKLRRPKEFKTFAIQFSTLIRGYTRQTQPIADILTFHYLGFKPQFCRVAGLAKGVLRFTNDIKEYLAICKDKRLIVRPAGVFLLLLECQLGESLVDDLIAKLRRLIRLITLLKSLKQQKFTPTKVSLDSVTFTYYNPTEPSLTNEPLTCTFNIPDHHTEPITISLNPTDSNPHTRVKPFLEYYLARSTTLFCHILPTTLPCLRALSRLESHGSGTVRNRALESFRIVYPQVPSVFDLTLRKRRSVQQWFLTEITPGSGQPAIQQQMLAQRPPGYGDAIAQLFKESGDGYRGLQNLMVCEIKGVESAIDMLDAKIREILASRPTQTGNAPPPQQSSGQTQSTFQQPGAPGGNIRRQPPSGRGVAPPGAAVITLD
jgi:hypothetical protein